MEKDNPFTWGEDFGLFTQHYPGAMFGLGSGTDQLYTILTTIFQTILLRLSIYFHHISKQITNAH
jgi:hypothetical protein